jgi:hypothetical protein
MEGVSILGEALDGFDLRVAWLDEEALPTGLLTMGFLPSVS